MNAEILFWEIQEIIQEKMQLMGPKIRQQVMDELEKDTGDSLLSFDLESIMENIS
jgi:hypothetical protein